MYSTDYSERPLVDCSLFIYLHNVLLITTDYMSKYIYVTKNIIKYIENLYLLRKLNQLLNNNYYRI